MLPPQIFKKSFGLCSGLFFAVFVIGLPAPVAALTVISPVVELTGNAGETVRGIVKIFNESKEPTALVSSVEPFSLNEQGQPVYTVPNGNAAGKWFTLDQPTITLASRQVAIIPFSIVIPRSATPGGHYATIFWQTDNRGNTPVTLNAKVGTVILLTVGGDIHQSATTTLHIIPAATVIWGGPVQFRSMVTNTGNIHLSLRGVVTVRSLYQKISLPLRTADTLILPEASRQFDVVWLSHNKATILQTWFEDTIHELRAGIIGPVTVTSAVHYGDSDVQAEPVTFWFIPVHAIGSIAGIIFLLILFFIINRRMTRLKKRIIATHEHPTS